MPQRAKPLPPISVIRDSFSYNPETGHFINLVSRTSRRVGERAETLNAKGYLAIWINGKHYYAHRLAWLWVHGENPSGVIDHINGDPADNRIANLRVCSHIENMYNARMRQHNTSGFKGVSWDQASKKWTAGITLNRRRIHLGRFRNKRDAIAEVARARIEFHGAFARSN